MPEAIIPNEKKKRKKPRFRNSGIENSGVYKYGYAGRIDCRPH